MTKKTKITPADILDNKTYSERRKDIRKTMMELKKFRRLAVGPAVMLYFENYETMHYQVQEMLHAEKGGDEQVREEIAAYNPLIPQGQELVATMMLEYSDATVRARELLKLGHIEEYVSIIIDDGRSKETIKATWEDDVDRTSPDGKTSSIHFLHFSFTPKQIEKFLTKDTQIVAAINHSNYGHMAIMPDAVKKAVSDDFVTQ